MQRAHHPDQRQTRAQGKTQLALLLSGCTDKMLVSFKAETLATMYPVPLKEIEYALTIARQRRAG